MLVGPPAAYALLAGSALPFLWAARAWVESLRMYYLLNPESRLGYTAWEVTPGRGIGPIELGTPGIDVLGLLGSGRACWILSGSAIYVLGDREAWVAACCLLSSPHADRSRPPCLADVERVVWVETSCPWHTTPEGIRRGLPVGEVSARLGPPLLVNRPSWGELRLYYPGLVVVTRRGQVHSLRVAGPDSACPSRPWHLV